MSKLEMRMLPEIAYASEYKNLSVTPNEVERQILLRARSRKSKERFSKLLRVFIESMSTSNDGEKNVNPKGQQRT